MANPFLLPILNWAKKLRHPTLFKIIAGLFVLDLVIPFDDIFPPFFIDELLLGLGTLLLANWKKRKEPDAPARPPIDGEANRR